MKNDRQSMILEIISQENIETQEQLLVRLQERGITSTQATISRDIKQMHLIKEPVGHGVYKYAVSGNRTRLNFAENTEYGFSSYPDWYASPLPPAGRLRGLRTEAVPDNSGQLPSAGHSSGT